MCAAILAISTLGPRAAPLAGATRKCCPISRRARAWRPVPTLSSTRRRIVPFAPEYRELRQIRGSATDQMVQIGRKTRGLQRSSLCRLTGNFLRPNRDLNRAIRVIFGLIRELGAGAPAPDLAGASAKKRTAHVFPKGPDEFTRA